MKKKFIKLFAVSIISITALVSCSEKENITLPSEEIAFKPASIYRQIAAMSAEISDFHDTAVHYWINNMYDSLEVLTTEDYFPIAYSMVSDFATMYDFDRISVDSIKQYMERDTSLYRRIVSIGQLKDSDFIAYLDTVSVNGMLMPNLSTKITNINNGLETIFESNTTYDDIEYDFEMVVQTELMNTQNSTEYACVLFYADVLFSSIQSWSGFLCDTTWGYATENGDKKPGFFTRLWDNTKRVAKADASTALDCVIVGVNSGLVDIKGYAALAASGAILGSAVEIVDIIKEKHNEKNQPVEDSNE